MKISRNIKKILIWRKKNLIFFKNTLIYKNKQELKKTDPVSYKIKKVLKKLISDRIAKNSQEIANTR